MTDTEQENDPWCACASCPAHRAQLCWMHRWCLDQDQDTPPAAFDIDAAFADLRCAAETVLERWDSYLAEPSVEAHRRLWAAINDLDRAIA
jgi:hypothetical protein